MADRKPYVADHAAQGGRKPYLAGRGTQKKRTPYLGGSHKTEAKTTEKKHEGFWHKVEKYSGAELGSNFVKDVGHTAVGVGPGLYRTVKEAVVDPAYNDVRHGPNSKEARHARAKQADLVKGTVKGYKDYYGHDVANHAYNHPLQPFLDALTVVSGGAGAVAKVGKIAADAGAISDTSQLAKLGDRSTVEVRSPRQIATGKGPKQVDITSTNPLVKGRQVAAAKVRSHPKIRERRGGEVAQYGKQIQAGANQHALGHLTAYQPYFKATHRLSQDEWAALHIRARDVHPEDLAHLWGDSPAGKIAADPKVAQLALNPTKKLLRAEQEARRLSETAGDFSVRHGMLSEEARAARPDLLKRLATGERYETPTPGKTGKPSQALIKGRSRVARLETMYERASARAAEKAIPYGNVHTRTGLVKQDLKTAPEAALKRQHIEVAPGQKTPGVPSDLPAKGIHTPTVERLGGALSVARDELASMEQAAAARVKPTGLVPKVPGQAPRQIHGQPYYVPDTFEPEKAVSPLGASGGGKAAPKDLASSKRNTGALALSGKLHLRGDVLGPEFLRRVKKVKYDEIHNALRRGAVRMTPQELETHYGGKLPKGYEFLRVKSGHALGPAEEPSAAIRPSMRAQGDQHVALDKLIPNPGDLHDSQLAKDGFSTTDPQAAHTSGGKFYVVPTRMVKAATGEFTRSGEFVHRFVNQPLSVWRALVLGLRVGFLTNNLVGNSVMYAVKTGGTGALRDLFMAIRESHGDGVAKKALDSAGTPPELRQSLYQEFFPEQMHGTFGKTQSPATSPAHIAGRKLNEGFRSATGAIPKVTSAVAETAYRKALIRNTIRRSPEFKTVYERLPKQTRNFENAAKHVLEGKGGARYQRYVSKQINHALGDYLNMAPFERNILRNAVPFYSWYRAIVTTTGHLAADTPLRANVLGQIGQIGRQWSDEKLGDVPSFLEGAIPFGDGKNGTKRVLATQGLNPYATLEQLRRGSAEDVTSLGLNPFLTAAMDAYAKKKFSGGIAPAELVGSTIGSMLAGLPPSRLAFPQPPSKLYPNRNRRTAEYGYLGVPIKEYNPHVAAKQKKDGR